MQDRVKPLSGVRNFRDFGGYSSSLGGRVRTGRLFRSAHFAEVTDADRPALDGLGVTLVTDLRRKDERDRQPNVWPPEGVQTLAADGDGEIAPHLALLSRPDLSPADVSAYMVRIYTGMPFDPRLVGLYQGWLAGLADTHEAGVIHCAAGKDRTGFGVAVTQALLGVDGDTVLEDYLLTNTAVDLEARMDEVAASLSGYLGRKVEGHVVRPFLGVEEAYLAAALKSVTERHGDIVTYAEAVLGVDGARREALRARFLTSV
jgi:protein tyrosine/serine phosphatase